MSVPRRLPGGRILLTPREPLVGGGAAEAFERQIQQLFRTGLRHIVVDLSGVGAIDSAGVRALVRGHTSARRVEGTFRLAAVSRGVAAVLEISKLHGIFESYDSVDSATIASWPWAAIRTVLGGIGLCTLLVWIGLLWPAELAGAADAAPGRFQPFLELTKLVAAALVGVLVTAVHQPSSHDRPGGRAMEHAQMLLAVSGALMMIIIGDSLARAFGIAGGASIIRFRTPVDNPKDVTILFLLMGLGMSVGLGAFAVAGLGTAFLCLTLVALDRLGGQPMRLMSVEIVAGGRDFPSSKVEEVFARNQIVFEPREIEQSSDVTVKYHVWLDTRTSLDDLSAQLLQAAAGVTGVAWEHPKRL